MKTFRPRDLAQYNGKDGNPTYVVYKEKVYDVSASKLWKGGVHMRRHSAGGDLTTDIQAAPHSADVLERYPQVGIVEKEPPEAGGLEAAGLEAPALPATVALLLEKNPFFRRHPHPMTVHFPIVFMLAAPIFTVLYLLTGHAAFDTTAFHSLAAGVLFSAVAISTGVITWRYNYLGKMMLPIAIKLPLSVVMTAVAAVAFFWRLIDPGVLTDAEGAHKIYLVVVFALIPMISVIGWYGATMTFPIEEE